MANWLSGWAKRIKITLDSGDIDADLTHFPVLVYLSVSSGINAADVTAIFDEVGSNSKKIAVTKDDGITQLYVEIEKWDATNEKAWLWVSKSDWIIDDTVDTEIYLYYDNSHVDNTDYVGDPNSTPAEAVWDSSFKLVTHMRDDPDTSHIRDSTSNNNDGTKLAANEPIVTTDGKLDDAQDFDGLDDRISIPHSSELNLGTGNFTVEAWVNATDPQLNNYPMIVGKRQVALDGWFIALWQALGDATKGRLYIQIAGINYPMAINPDLRDGLWHHIVVRRTGTTGTYRIDNVSQGGFTSGGNMDSTHAVWIGSDEPALGNVEWKGRLDEIRIMNIYRSDAWAKVSYETQRDHILTYGNEESLKELFELINFTSEVNLSRLEELFESLSFVSEIEAGIFKELFESLYFSDDRRMEYRRTMEETLLYSDFISFTRTLFLEEDSLFFDKISFESKKESFEFLYLSDTFARRTEFKKIMKETLIYSDLFWTSCFLMLLEESFLTDKIFLKFEKIEKETLILSPLSFLIKIPILIREIIYLRTKLRKVLRKMELN